MKLQEILHPTDFSENAQHALRYAAEIARRTGARLHIVHVYEIPYVNAYYHGHVTSLIDKDLKEKIVNSVNEKLREIADDHHLEGVEVTTYAVEDRQIWKFYEAPELPDGDLIVMGTMGHTGFLHGGIIGTNANRTIRHSPIPVLSVPAQAKLQAPQHILFVTDYTDPPEPNFSRIVSMAQLFEAEILVATISTPVEYFATAFVEQEFNKLQEKYPNQAMRAVPYNAYSLQEGIRELIRREAASLVAMQTHGRTGLLSFFQASSQTEELASHLEAPLLALKAQQVIDQQ